MKSNERDKPILEYVQERERERQSESESEICRDGLRKCRHHKILGIIKHDTLQQ